MRLLVLGGTLFLGRHVVEAALAGGHEVSIFTRGETNPGLFPDVERLRGDRDGNLSALEGRSWDCVIDTSGYVPRVVRASAQLLRDAAPHYTFVSSVSVYADFATIGLTEDSPTARLEDPASEDVREHYGALKALCEQTVRDIYGDAALIVRPGLIVGPDDPTGRFTYWPARVARGGEVLAPGRPDRQVQFVDVRDLAEWQLRLAAERRSGVFNATGHVPEVTMGELLETCIEVSGSDARLVWVEDAFLVERDVGEWMELPLWIADPEWLGIHAADVSHAIAAGLTFRPLEETVRATLEWEQSRTGPIAKRQGPPVEEAGLAPEREAELLAAWSADAS